MIDLSMRRVLDTLNSRYLYGRVVRDFPQRHDCLRDPPIEHFQNMLSSPLSALLNNS